MIGKELTVNVFHNQKGFLAFPKLLVYHLFERQFGVQNVAKVFEGCRLFDRVVLVKYV